MNAYIPVFAGLLASGLVFALPSVAESQSETRKWTDSSGKHQVVALLANADAEHVWLRKTSGQVKRVPVERLSAPDQEYVRAHQRESVKQLPSAAAGAFRALQQAGRNQFLSERVRGWSDNTGAFDAKASLIGVNESGAILKKLGGQIIEVPLSRLSERDRIYLREKSKDWSPMNVLRPVASQVVPQVEGILNGETPTLDVFPTPDAVHIRVGKAYLNRRYARDLDKTVPVNDRILGTPIRGKAVVVGDVKVVPVPFEGKGALMVVVTGTADSQTVGTHHPVWIHSDGHTEFRGTKRIFLTDDGVTFQPAKVTSTTRSRTTGISTSLPRLRGRIARRIAADRVNESRPAADRISGQHNEVRVARDIDRQVEESLKRTDVFLREHKDRVREALGLGETRTVYSSTDDYLEFAFLGKDVKDDAPSPPEFIADSDLEIVLHTPTLTPTALGPGAKMLLTNLFNVLLDDVLEERADRRDLEPVNCRLVWSRDQQWLAIQADRPEPVEVTLAPTTRD
jgi:hypothetical protein